MTWSDTDDLLSQGDDHRTAHRIAQVERGWVDDAGVRADLDGTLLAAEVADACRGLGK